MHALCFGTVQWLKTIMQSCVFAHILLACLQPLLSKNRYHQQFGFIAGQMVDAPPKPYLPYAYCLNYMVSSTDLFKQHLSNSVDYVKR